MVDCARLIVQGWVPYIDYVGTNSPMVQYIYISPVYLARILNLEIPTAFYINNPFAKKDYVSYSADPDQRGWSSAGHCCPIGTANSSLVTLDEHVAFISTRSSPAYSTLIYTKPPWHAFFAVVSHCLFVQESGFR